jgi:heme-degrading monooxygenase HmoA
MSIKVMIKRKWQVDQPEELLPLLAALRATAREQPGFVSGETLRSLDDPEHFLVISIWETAEDWEKWMQNKERRDLQGKVDSLIGEKTFYEMFETVSME